jgi:hypothetical protein
VTWVLLWLVTRAWLAEHRAARAGAWLGAAIAIKPPFALMALMLAWPILFWAGVVAASLTSAAVAVTGLDPWLSWLRLNRAVDWLALRPNMSLWGVAARIESVRLTAVHLSDIPMTAVVAILLVGVALAIVVRRATGARRWLLAGLWTLTMSPLGWTYYLPVFLGPAAATTLSRRWALVTAIVLMALPIPALYAVLAPIPGGTALAASVYSIALGLLWVVW